MADENKNCLLCGATSKKKTKLLWECLRCRLLFKDPAGFSDFTQEKERYLTHNNDVEDTGYIKYLGKLWGRIPKPKGKVLDYGCGHSKGLEYLVQKNKTKDIKVDSYDPIFFPEGIEEDSYDIIYASESFEHFYKPKEEIENILQLLKTGGRLAVSTVLSDGVDLKSWWYLNDHTHVVFYSTETFKWIGREYSLEVLFQESPHSLFVKS